MATRGKSLRKTEVLSLSGIAFILFSAELAGRMAVQLMLNEQGAPLLVTSISTTMCWLGALAGGVMWGGLADRYPARWLMLAIGAGATGSIAILTTEIPTSAILTMSFARLLALSGSAPIAMAIISRKSSLERRGRNLSGILASRSIGATVGLMGGGLLIGLIGFRGTFATLAVWSSLALVIVALAGQIWEGKKPVSPQRIRLLGGPVHRLFWATVLRQMAIVGTSSLIYVYMQELSIRSDWMGGISALNPATQILGLFLCGRLADRLGRRHVFLLGFVLSAIAPMIYAVASSSAHMAAGFVVHGFGFGALYIGSAAYIGDVTPAKMQGRMFGLHEASFAAGGVIGPILSGTIATYIGLRPMLWVMTAVASCAVVLASTQATGTRQAGA